MLYKKFESYINDKKIGTINVNSETCKKKYNTGVLAAIITPTSLTGYSLVNNTNNKAIVNNEKIDSEISKKLAFVDSVLFKLDNIKDTPIYKKIMDAYRQLKKIEHDIDPENEYSIFYTQEEIENKKSIMLTCLNTIINTIETTTSIKYGVDFINTEKTK